MKKTYVVKVRKSEDKINNVVPMHPEFLFLGSLAANSWEAKNTETGELVTIKRVEKGDFVEYEIKEK